MRRRVPYPYSVMSPLRLDREPAHMASVILQSVSGGIFADERLTHSIEVLSGAARVMTPSATVVHAMPEGSQAIQTPTLVAGPGALLEWLPQPLVLFPHSRLAQTIVVNASPQATVLVSEGFLTHDHTGRDASFDWLDSQIELRRHDGRLIARDHSRCCGHALSAPVPGIAGRFCAFGTVLVCAELSDQRITRLHEALIASAESISNQYVGATTLRGSAGLLLRIAACDGGSLVQAIMTVTRRVHCELVDSCLDSIHPRYFESCDAL